MPTSKVGWISLGSDLGGTRVSVWRGDSLNEQLFIFMQCRWKLHACPPFLIVLVIVLPVDWRLSCFLAVIGYCGVLVTCTVLVPEVLQDFAGDINHLLEICRNCIFCRQAGQTGYLPGSGTV